MSEGEIQDGYGDQCPHDLEPAACSFCNPPAGSMSWLAFYEASLGAAVAADEEPLYVVTSD